MTENRNQLAADETEFGSLPKTRDRRPLPKRVPLRVSRPLKFLTVAAGLLCLGWQVRGDAFADFAAQYEVITTVAGTGEGTTDGINYWSASFEGGPAVSARLSRPHMAQADDAGKIGRAHV